MSFITLFVGLPILVLTLFLLAKWASGQIPEKNVIALSVSAGDVRLDAPDLPPPVTFSTTKILFKAKNGKIITPDEDKHFIGRVQGSSMAHYGIKEGAIFIAEKAPGADVRPGQIWVLNTPELDGRNHGRKKLRKIDDVHEDGSLTTSTVKNGEKTTSNNHHAENCMAKVLCYTTTPVSETQLKPLT